MVVSDPNSVKVYTVNGAAAGSASSLPDWLTRKRAAKAKGKRAIREHVEGTIELIQHFEFPEASNRVKSTRDGHHVIATGTYKPQMRVWDLDQLALKFERHSDVENVDFIILSDDWTKTLHLQADRTVELHTQGGFHYRTRIPRFGRSLAYHFPTCDALLGASGPEVYRLNLEQGRYLSPLVLGGKDSSTVEGVNAIDVNPAHGLWSFGIDGNGTVEFWDPRSRSSLGVLELPVNRLMPGGTLGSTVLPGIEGVSGPGLSITALASRSDGLSYAVGTSSGHTLLYDIRSRQPFAMKDQGYGLPVKQVSWIEGGGRMAGDGLVLSADKKVVKIWDRNTPSENFASLTPSNDLNDIHHISGSGLLMTANEGIQMTTYYIPQLGPAPRWCSFLENLTEELEEGPGGARGVYEDYKFVSRAELATLGLDHLSGTPALKPYMHGYFISLKLYDAARIIANPYVYEEHREKMVQEKMEKLAEGRIRARKDQQNVKVNKALAEKLARDEERARKKDERKSKKKSAAPVGEGAEAMDVDDEQGGAEKDNLLSDPRFKALFEDPEFEVDETTREFALLNPSTAARNDPRGITTQGQGWGRGKTAVEDEEDESEKASSADEDDESDNSDADSEDSSAAGDLLPSETLYQSKQSARRPPKASVRLVPLRAQSSTVVGKEATFGQRRIASSSRQASSSRHDRTDHVVRKADGSVEMSWVPAPKSKASRVDADMDDEDGKLQRQRDTRKGVERFGAGMEKGGEDPIRQNMSEQDRSGRQERRRGVRSGSKNTFRRM
ncbi:hypothetical protein BV25DRAFT_1822387 [Artomyces pyxidatus]|uniref:Uncharacterized protein n=1 Tax=Artomyces pyxidatus TaxID=48021 RepID=A0ACB8T8V6_9AGAM|nr:hypothetical protein BV25DRAFT_1822387 [Artomyces pyxidatus]